ncbi:MAG: succinate dehydrogenase, cytochrome b556 subunit [Thermoleophilia bacterium]
MSGKDRETANVGAGLWKGAGMWAWLFHRVSGLVLALYLFAHIWVISTGAAAGADAFDTMFKTLESPFFIVLDLALLAAVVYHAFNGIRVILFDLGIAIRQQKTLWWVVIGASVAVMAVFAVISFSYIASHG